MTLCAAALSVAVFGQRQDSNNRTEYKTDLLKPSGQPSSSETELQRRDRACKLMIAGFDHLRPLSS